MKIYLGLLVLALAGVALAEKVRYDDYKVFQLAIESEEQLDALKVLEENYNQFNFWIYPSFVGQRVDIMVPPSNMAMFDEFLAINNFESELKIENVQALSDAEMPEVQPRAFGWESYYRTTDIYGWLDEMLAANPTILTGFNAGSSYSGWTIRGVKLSYKSGNPGIFIEANIHAREWITSATATWILNELITSTDSEIRNIAENYDWYIIPMMNPDGFEYSHDTDRMWRKTRSPNSGSTCVGTDANRNWGYNWMQGGASNNPCSETFAGSAAYSEIEVQTVSDYYLSIKDNLNLYLSFHSYGQYVLFPWGHITTRVSNYDDLLSMAQAFQTRCATVHGTTYTYGSTAEHLYIASGTSPDWTYGTAGTMASFTLEFRDKGSYGFQLPASQIIPNARETLQGLIGMIAKGGELGYFD